MAGPRTKVEIEKILDTLEKNDGSTQSSELERLLTQLHTSTRSLADAALQPLYSKSGVHLLGRYAFGETPKPEHLPALRCLNNVLVRSPLSRQLLSSEIGAPKIASLLNRKDPEDELALANIIIFSCHGTSLDLSSCFENNGIAAAVNAIITRHVKEGTLPTAEPTSRCSASLRLLSSLAARYESHSHLFLDAVDPVLGMLSETTIASPPLQPPVSLLVNCLPVLPIQKKTTISVDAVDKLIEILKECLYFYKSQDKEGEFMPLLFGLQRIAQSEATDAKARLQERLIPTDEDRKIALGKGNTLPHKVLHMSNMSASPEVREVIMALFFELSDKDPSMFVHNVGFGNAAGYLASQGIQISQKDLTTRDSGPDVNPITGQRVDSEAEPILPDMTDEEKEREAERLFVLFERLKATGVVDVENPVAQAIRKDRIQELPDDYNSDDDI